MMGWASPTIRRRFARFVLNPAVETRMFARVKSGLHRVRKRRGRLGLARVNTLGGHDFVSVTRTGAIAELCSPGLVVRCT